MASAQRSAKEYLRNTRKNLVTGMKNLPLIIESLYQKKVFNVYNLNDLKAESSEFEKARCILDWVINKGDEASYELLKILDVTKKRTLDPGLHYWISCSPFRDEDAAPSYLFGTKPCKNYQKQLKDKAKEKSFFKYLEKTQVNFSFIPLVLETDSAVKTPQCKIKLKNKKCKKLRPKKLRAYIPNEEQALSPEDLLRWQDKNILIIGKPGVGKTTVVQEMLRLWAEKDDRQIDYMFYFDESVLAHSSSTASLEALLFDVYIKPMEKYRKEVFQDIEENSENVVIVFDCVTNLGKKSILWKIMKHELLPNAKIVITCRSEEEEDPLFSDWPTRTVYVQGFSEESINTYYQKMLGHNPVLLEVILKNQELFSLSHVPMYAFMVAASISFKNFTVNNHTLTVTKMYIHIFRLTVMTHGEKKIEEIDEILREIEDQIHPLMKTAFSATMKKTLNFNSCDKKNVCHAFLKNITLQDSVSSATTYCAFLHNTMQEFFSALWLLGHPDEIENVLQLCQTEEHKHMRHVLPFLCGLLSEHNTSLLKCLFPEDQIKKTSDWFIEKRLDTFLQPQSEEFDLLYVCLCLYELQSPKACLMFLEQMDHQLEPEVDLDPHQCCALSYVIGQSRDKEVYLNLEDCTVADVGMNMMEVHACIWLLNTCKDPLKQITFFVEFFHKSSHCDCKHFEVRGQYKPEKNNALLDLYSHVKNYENQTGRGYLPALQSVFQSPDVWIIDLSERKSSVLLEVLKLQRKKKPVNLRGCSEEESEVKSFLQCLQHISQLRLSNLSKSVLRKFLLRLFIKAAEIETQTGEQMLKLLASHYEWSYIFYDCDFLLDLCSHVKNYETQTGRSYLPALQPVFQSPDEWFIDLSQRKSSVLLEVLKLQTKKKIVYLSGYSEEESEVKSVLQCLQHISHLMFWFIDDEEERTSAVRFLLNLCVAAVETDKDAGTRFSTLLSSVCSYKTFPFDEDGYDQNDFLLDLCSHVKNYETQTGRSYLPALQPVFQSPDEWFIDLSERKSSVLLEVLKLQTEKKPVYLRGCSEEESEVMSFLQCLQHISQLRLSKVTLQKLVECVYEAQEEELTQSFLQKVGGDLTSCSLSWEELHYFLQHRIQQITVNLRKSNIQVNIREILPFLNRIKFKRMSSAFMLCAIREIYESGSAGFVSSLLSSVKNYINLQSRDLDSVDCAALHFTLQHCTAASLNLLWTSIPEEELQSILPLFTHLSHLSVDRLLLLKMLHCCSVSDVQQEAAAVLLSILQHKLDFSCRSALDLTANTDSEPLHLTADDCRVMSRVIQRAHSDTKTRLILQDCEIHTAGMDQLFPVLHSVQLRCDKPLLLQFLAHVRPEEAQSLSGALGEELDLSQTQLDLQVCRGLELILEYSEGLTELDLSQCHLTDHSLDLLLPNLHKAQNIDFSGNSITDAGAQKIHRIVTSNRNIKTVRLFNNRIESRELFITDPRFEIQ
ncbi:uncharacterized protein [Sinocyclocheilus grahami]|uniref:uncharacterized protein n=1 Tax=Sinocyclocheilus grahami TaxID=75366 RepID=UPI0007ACB923|nr:PREDICTED: uncharacterized protein LOC107575271 [Sinocyclocheilus grahami]